MRLPDLDSSLAVAIRNRQKQRSAALRRRVLRILDCSPNPEGVTRPRESLALTGASRLDAWYAEAK